jgi:hypothetical protein
VFLVSFRTEGGDGKENLHDGRCDGDPAALVRGPAEVEVARSLGVDVKTVRRYLAPAEAAGMRPGGPLVAEEQWRALARQWFP